MAKAKGNNRSQAIREYLEEKPESKAKDVVEALAAKGVEVSEGLVYSVRGAMNEKKKRKARVVRAAKAAAPSSNGHVNKADAITMIREVRALAAKAGGFAKLMELVDALAQ